MFRGIIKPHLLDARLRSTKVCFSRRNESGSSADGLPSFSYSNRGGESVGFSRLRSAVEYRCRDRKTRVEGFSTILAAFASKGVGGPLKMRRPATAPGRTAIASDPRARSRDARPRGARRVRLTPAPGAHGASAAPTLGARRVCPTPNPGTRGTPAAPIHRRLARRQGRHIAICVQLPLLSTALRALCSRYRKTRDAKRDERWQPWVSSMARSHL